MVLTAWSKNCCPLRSLLVTYMLCNIGCEGFDRSSWVDSRRSCWQSLHVRTSLFGLDSVEIPSSSVGACFVLLLFFLEKDRAASTASPYFIIRLLDCRFEYLIFHQRTRTPSLSMTLATAEGIKSSSRKQDLIRISHECIKFHCPFPPSLGNNN